MVTFDFYHWLWNHDWFWFICIGFYAVVKTPDSFFLSSICVENVGFQTAPRCDVVLFIEVDMLLHVLLVEALRLVVWKDVLVYLLLYLFSWHRVKVQQNTWMIYAPIQTFIILLSCLIFKYLFPIYSLIGISFHSFFLFHFCHIL